MKNNSYYSSKNYRILPKSFNNIHKNITYDDEKEGNNISYIVKDIRNLISNEKLKNDEQLQFSLCFYNLDENEKNQSNNKKETFFLENSKGEAKENDVFDSQVSKSNKTCSPVFKCFFSYYIKHYLKTFKIKTMLTGFSPYANYNIKGSYLNFNSQIIKKHDFHEGSEKHIILKEGLIKKQNPSHIKTLQRIYGFPKKTFPFQKDFSIKKRQINEKISNPNNDTDFFPLIIQKSYTTKKL